MTQRSAVATLLAQISDEYDAAYRALYGLSSHSSQHRIISAHMERAGEVSEELSILIGKDAAAPYIVDTLNTAIDKARSNLSKPSTGDNENTTQATPPS